MRQTARLDVVPHRPDRDRREHHTGRDGRAAEARAHGEPRVGSAPRLDLACGAMDSGPRSRRRLSRMPRRPAARRRRPVRSASSAAGSVSPASAALRSRPPALPRRFRRCSEADRDRQQCRRGDRPGPRSWRPRRRRHHSRAQLRRADRQADSGAAPPRARVAASRPLSGAARAAARIRASAARYRPATVLIDPSCIVAISWNVSPSKTWRWTTSRWSSDSSRSARSIVSALVRRCRRRPAPGRAAVRRHPLRFASPAAAASNSRRSGRPGAGTRGRAGSPPRCGLHRIEANTCCTASSASRRVGQQHQARSDTARRRAGRRAGRRAT